MYYTPKNTTGKLQPVLIVSGLRNLVTLNSTCCHQSGSNLHQDLHSRQAWAEPYPHTLMSVQSIPHIIPHESVILAF